MTKPQGTAGYEGAGWQLESENLGKQICSSESGAWAVEGKTNDVPFFDPFERSSPGQWPRIHKGWKAKWSLELFCLLTMIIAGREIRQKRILLFLGGLKRKCLKLSLKSGLVQITMICSRPDLGLPANPHLVNPENFLTSKISPGILTLFPQLVRVASCPSWTESSHHLFLIARRSLRTI